MEENITLENLYLSLLEGGRKVIRHKNYEMIYCGDVEIKTFGNRYVKIEYVSRHKTPKHLVRIGVDSSKGEDSVTVTTDHVCMVYNSDHFFENLAAKDVTTGQTVSVYDENRGEELFGTISNIQDLGTTEEYVYDIEVDDDIHAFYADNILVHNSQFISIRCITEDFRRKYGLPLKIVDWPDDKKLELWRYMEDFVEKDLNVYIQDLVTEYCHTSNSKVLRYSLEYIADMGIYESKKHYGVRKVLSDPGPEIVDKIKYSGIELKKGNIPPTAKEFLSTIYEGVLRNDWTSEDYRKYLNVAYERYRKLDITEISFWKGYGTEREAAGFLEMKKGTTGISKACTFYNQILEKMGIGGRYDTLRPGNKARFCYIKPTNKYRINVIAFVDGQYPEEFRGLFEPDYDVMFEKMILDPLKNFLKACGFRKSDPRNCNLMEVDDL